MIKKFLYFLTPHERKNAAVLLGMILVMALLDMIGVASILPFIAVLTNPSLVETNIILNTFFQSLGMFGVETNQQFLFVLGIVVFILLIFSLLFKALTTYMQMRFVQMREYSIAKRLVESYLNQPYNWFLNRNSSDLGKTILSEVTYIIMGGFSPMINLIAQGTVAISLLILLILIDIKLALTVGFTLGLAYALIYKFCENFLNHIGEERLKANQSRFKAISEAFGAFKEIKVSGLEQPYLKRFANPAHNMARHQTSSNMIKQLPRFAMEAIAFGGMLLVILYLISKNDTFTDVIPVIALYAFAGYRLMPAMQQIFVAFTSLRVVGPALDALYEDQKKFQPFNLNQEKDLLKFNENITLKNIEYQYPNSSRTVLKDINLTIPINSTVGFVGSTGSGKTTTIDLILGLLEAQKGTLEVDGKVINKNNVRAWQRSIGYVPQHIYLADDTVEANIAFGVELKDINQDMVKKASKIANLHDFIADELPKQYETTIGERGVRLSGGQRQRIGIARALYHNQKVLILDEATSALDNQTEKAVMDAINNLNKNITIILIAHRLSTVKNCDTIFLLDKGQLQDKGTFEELIKNNNQFRNSVKIN
jgi:ATP-binding cassette, subfamily B, bacterial PglK